MNRYKLSIVNYTNTLPFRHGIIKSGLIGSIDLEYDIPSVCAQKVIEKKVDMGLIPVAVIPLLKEHHLVGNFCLGSRGKVDTVKLYSCAPLEKIKSILLDHQSRTSVTLVQVLAKFHWKTGPVFTPAPEGFEKQVEGATAAVVIGDRCFDMNGKFPFEYDLAFEWTQLTGLPFVFAAWVSNKKPEDAFVKVFELALRYGVQHTREAVKEYIEPGRQELITTYLTERICYDFDDEMRRSMLHFLHLLKQL